jgi:hypothetical protein
VVRALPVIGLADHSRLLIVVHLGLAVLAARGLERLGTAPARRAMAIAAAALAAALVVLAAGGVSARTALVAPTASLGFALAILVLAAGSSMPRALPAATWLAVLLVVADLYAAYGPRPRGGTRALPAAPPAFAPLAGRPGGGRALIANTVLPPNVAAFYEVPSLAAFEPSMSEATMQLLVQAGLTPSFHLGTVAPAEVGPTALRVLDLLGATTFMLPGPVSDATVRAHLREVRREPLALYENPHAMPRVFAVSEARVAADGGAALALVADPAIDLRRTVVLEVPPANAPHGGEAEATLVAYAPGRVRVRSTCRNACWIVLTETWARGWRATVDGRPTPALRADRALVAAAAPAGAHEVELAYRPRSVLVGAPISLLVLCALAAAALRPSRLAPPGSAR